MCMNCGCGQPNNDHGDRRNITMNDLDQAAQAAGITREQAMQNMMDCCGMGAMGAMGSTGTGATQSQAGAPGQGSQVQ